MWDAKGSASESRGLQMVPRTALELTQDEWLEFHPARAAGAQFDGTRWAQAWQVARAIAQMLRTRFGTERIVVFGSLARRTDFTHHSDIDIATWGISSCDFHRAVTDAEEYSQDFRVDVIDVSSSPEKLCKAIESEGVEL